MLHQRLQGAFLAIIGLAGLVGGVMFSIEAPRFTPVPVVFLTFWLVMVIVGRILFTGLDKLRSAGVSAPAPSQVRAAAAVAAIVVAVGMMGFAATSVGTGTAVAAPCPGGGPPTCGPDPGGPTLTFTPPPGQTITPGGAQPGLPGGQQGGIATSPTRDGGGNGSGIQAQTPQFGTPGQQAPNIPGNEPPSQPGQSGQQPQGTQAQQNPARTTAPGGPQQTDGQQPGQSASGQPSPSTVTVTKTESQCPLPGTGAGNGPGGTGSDSSNDGGGAGTDDEQKDGAPSWAYLVGEAAGVMAGRRRNPSRGTQPTADQAWKLWGDAQAGRSPEEMARMAGLKLNPDGTSADPSYDIITVPKEDGDYQKLILMKNRDAPREYRFPLNTPEGGRSVKNDDGSISVFDRNGDEVGQFDAPWAYDANGRKVPTWYDIEGDEMVQHIEPGPDNVYPIIADPLWDSIKDKAKSVGSGVKNFSAGVGRSVLDTAEGIGTMVTHPVDTAKGMAPLVGLGGDGAPGVGESWGAVGKAFIAKDDFDRGDIAYGAGKVTGNVLLALADPTKGGGKVASAGKVAKGAEEVAQATAKTTGKAADAASDAASVAARTATDAAGDTATIAGRATDGAGDTASTASKATTDAVGDAVSTGTQGATNAVQMAGKDTAQTAARLGESTTKSYRETFFAANPSVPLDSIVHHAIEQSVLTRHPGLVTPSQMHSLENLRGIPSAINNTVHLSEIRKMWNSFYRTHPAATTTVQDLLDFATQIDDRFGHLFNPPIR